MSARDPNKVDIYDATLREGMQTVGVSMDIDGRVKVATQLDLIGVDVIEAGFPGSGPATGNHELEAVQAVAVTVEGAKVAALCRVVPGDIENGWAAVEPAKDRGGSRLHLFVSTSDIQMKEQGKTPKDVIDLTRSEVARAKALCNDVEFSPMDATRSGFAFMMKVCQIAVEQGATVINIPDTTGYMTHRQFGRLIGAVRHGIHEFNPEVIISAHTHGDRGLSAAANMEAIATGARQIEVTVNGIGPRLGNAGLADIVGNIREGGEPLPVAVYTDVDASFLKETSRLVANLSGKEAPDNLAFTSPTAFAHAEGIHQHDIAGNPRSFESLDAEAYGQEPGQIVLGPLCGRVGVGTRLKNIGIELAEDDLNAITTKVKDMAVEQGRNLADNDIEMLAAEITGDRIGERFRLVSVDCSESRGRAYAKVKIDGKSRWFGMNSKKTVRLRGEGAIDALVTAINQVTGFEDSVAEWSGSSLEPGEDAEGGISVRVRRGDSSVLVYAKGNSVLQASANAYMTGVNMLCRVEQRKPGYWSRMLSENLGPYDWVG